MGPGGAVVRDDMGRITAKKVSGLEHEAVAGAWVSPPGVRQRSVQPRRERARSPNPAGSSASAMPAFQSLSPKVSRTAGIGDSVAVVGEGNAGAIAILLNGCGNLTPSRARFELSESV